MPALDQCEPQVIRALQKAGWVVTHQPLQIRISREEAFMRIFALYNQQLSRRLL